MTEYREDDYNNYTCETEQGKMMKDFLNVLRSYQRSPSNSEEQETKDYMACYTKLHPWDVFLKARFNVIIFFLKQGKTHAQIAETLSMDAEQVSAILQSAKYIKNKDFFYSPHTTEE
jgi:hypothetical protein